MLGSESGQESLAFGFAHAGALDENWDRRVLGVELLLHRGEVLIGREVSDVVAAPSFDQRGDGLHHVR